MRAIRSVLLLGVLAPAASVADLASATSPPASAVRCSWHAHITSHGYRYKGALVGAVRCGTRFGKGVTAALRGQRQRADSRHRARLDKAFLQSGDCFAVPISWARRRLQGRRAITGRFTSPMAVGDSGM